jgi:hypothetical protein
MNFVTSITLHLPIGNMTPYFWGLVPYVPLGLLGIFVFVGIQTLASIGIPTSPTQPTN